MRGEMLSTVTYYPEPALVRLPGVHSLIQMHVPDQTGRRSLHLHCSLDLNRNVPTLIGCKQDSNLGGANSPRVFIPLNGAQRHRDRQDCLPHIAAGRKLKWWFACPKRSLPYGRGSDLGPILCGKNLRGPQANKCTVIQKDAIWVTPGRPRVFRRPLLF